MTITRANGKRVIICDDAEMLLLEGACGDQAKRCLEIAENFIGKDSDGGSTRIFMQLADNLAKLAKTLGKAA